MTTGGWIFSILGTLILLALIVGTIVWIVSNPGARGGRGDLSALEILERRLASGAITIDQYHELRKTLDAESALNGDHPSVSAAGAPG